MKQLKHLKPSILAGALGCLSMPFVHAAEPSGGLSEIVVTAQKRAESLQEVPVAVSAFTEMDLQNKGIDNITGIADFTPNLIMDETATLSGSSSALVLHIRGVGQSSYQITDDPGVGTYVDGVYIGSSVGGVLDTIDVERIEVLRGPQGTLFGRNTIGGAINITTKRPADERQASFEVTVGNYNRINTRASVDIPINDQLKTKFSVSTKDADGWVNLIAEDQLTGTEVRRNEDKPGSDNEAALRFAALYTPLDTLSFYVTYDKSRIDEASAPSSLINTGKSCTDPVFQPGGGGVIKYPVNEELAIRPLTGEFKELCTSHGLLTEVWNANAGSIDVPGYGTGVPYDDRWIPDNPARESYRTGPNGTKVDTDGFATTIDWDINENISLKSISSIRQVDSKLNRDADGSPLTVVHCYNDFEHTQWSQEIQLSGTSADSNLKWLAGVYYFEEDAEDYFRCSLPIGSLVLAAEVENDSYAAFSQATYTLFDNLNITLGLRWNRDNKTMDPVFGFYDNFRDLNLIVYNVIPGHYKEKYTNTTPRVSIDYNLMEGVLLYASYSEGFKSGGFSSRTLVPRGLPLTFEPEELKSYEVGVKYEGFDNRLRANLAIFQSEYKDIQGTVIEGIAPGTQTIGDSDIDGFELEITALPLDRLLVNATVGYLNNKYTRVAPLSLFVEASDGFIEDNYQLVNSPEWSYTASVEYTLPVAAIHGDLVGRLDWSHYSTVYNDDLNNPFLKQEPYGLLNGQLAYVSDDGSWQFVLWGKNLEDKKYLMSGDANVYAGFYEANYGTPRTYGITIRHNL